MSPAADPWGPVRALTVAFGLWLLLELSLVARVAWKHRQEDRAIRGAHDVYLPAGWGSQDHEGLRQRILRLEKKRRG